MHNSAFLPAGVPSAPIPVPQERLPEVVVKFTKAVGDTTVGAALAAIFKDLPVAAKEGVAKWRKAIDRIRRSGILPR